MAIYSQSPASTTRTALPPRLCSPTTRSQPVGELLETFTEAGGRIGVCPPCAKTHGVTQETLVGNAEFMGGAAVIGAAEERQTFSF